MIGLIAGLFVCVCVFVSAHLICVEAAAAAAAVAVAAVALVSPRRPFSLPQAKSAKRNLSSLWA